MELSIRLSQMTQEDEEMQEFEEDKPQVVDHEEDLERDARKIEQIQKRQDESKKVVKFGGSSQTSSLDEEDLED